MSLDKEEEEQREKKHTAWLSEELRQSYKLLSDSLREKLEREYGDLEREQIQRTKSYLTIQASLMRISAISGIPEPLVEQTIGRMCAGLTVPFSEMVGHINSFFVVKRSIEEEQKEKKRGN